MVDYRPGLDGVIATQSSISDIDGKNGILSYRGYSIEELAKTSSFEEVAYLLMAGELPKKSQLETFKSDINKNQNLPENLIKFLNSLPKDTDSMQVLQMTAASLGTFYPIKFDSEKAKAKEYKLDYFLDIAAKLIGSLGSVVPAWHRIRFNKKTIPSQNKLNFADNFLNMLDDENESSDLVRRIMDATFILHAEHTINASTFTAMVTASTLSKPFQVISSAIGSLAGPLHGGANQKVVSMLEKIGKKENVRSWLEKTLNEKKVVWGMGHREYSVKDPRANILTTMTKELFDEKGDDISDLFDTAIELESACNETLSKKGVYANVDFYSGILYREMGIPVDLFTTVFAISRVSGWVAHWAEQISDNKIFRPTQIYQGSSSRKYIKINDR